jgi:hypothetical protein
MDEGSIARVAARPFCTCDDKCCQHMSFEEREDLVTRARGVRCAIPGRHLTSSLIEVLLSVAAADAGKVKYSSIVVLGQVAVCVSAYRTILGWQHGVWYSATTKVRELLLSGEDVNDEEGDGNIVRHRGSTTRCYGWCRLRLDEAADGVDPSANSNRAGKRMLDRQDLNEWYVDYLQEMEDRHDFEVVCPQSFRKRCYNQARKDLNIWDREWMPFAQCATCAENKQALRVAKSKQERDKLRKERSEHLLLQRSQRDSYYARRELACKRPEEYMSVIVDGMDQSKAIYYSHSR